MNPARMPVHELAKALGKSPVWVMDELRRDSKRDVKRWSFATSTQSETGRWSYVIIRSQFERWKIGANSVIDYEFLADMIANHLMEKLSQTAIWLFDVDHE